MVMVATTIDFFMNPFVGFARDITRLLCSWSKRKLILCGLVRVSSFPGGGRRSYKAGAHARGCAQDGQVAVHIGPDMLAGGSDEAVPERAFAEPKASSNDNRFRIQHVDQQSHSGFQRLGSGLNHCERAGIAIRSGGENVFSRCGCVRSELIKPGHQGRAGRDLFQGATVHMAAPFARQAQRAASHGTRRSSGPEVWPALEHQAASDSRPDTDIEENLKEFSGAKQSLGHGGRADVGFQRDRTEVAQVCPHLVFRPGNAIVAGDVSGWLDELANANSYAA